MMITINATLYLHHINKSDKYGNTHRRIPENLRSYCPNNAHFHNNYSFNRYNWNHSYGQYQ